MSTTNLCIRMDKNLKKQAESLFDEMGMSLTTALTIFIKQSLRQKKIPFEITVENDNFYSEENIKRLEKSIENYKNGKFVTRTIEELEAMKNA